MRSFKDNEGRQWTVDINVSAVKRVRGLTGTDLMQVIEGTGGLIEKLIRDPVLLCDVVYAICKPEADARSVSDEEFGRAMAGDAIEAATMAVLDELVGFCPSPRDRANLGRVLQATRKVMDRARGLVEKKLDSGELDRLADRLLSEGQTAGSSSTSAPESLASTPAP
ncbi:MAG TPA: hypothetical protein PKE29_10070 [Phycisphaerales bacterium]|nr:hypothetical protein [Phycisphaerales bacterium]